MSVNLFNLQGCKYFNQQRCGSPKNSKKKKSWTKNMRNLYILRKLNDFIFICSKVRFVKGLMATQGRGLH